MDNTNIQNSEAAVPAVQKEYSGPTGLSSNITSQDLRLPRVALLQALSPQVQSQPEIYRQGMFIDTLTQDVLTAPVSFIPVFIFKNVIKWKPRNEGGGMLWKTTTITPEVAKELQWNGTTKPTADLYYNAVCLLDGQSVPIIISFCKTSLKAGQDLATLATLSGYSWKFKYTLESVKTTKDNNTFYVMRVKRGVLTTPEETQEAADLYEQVKGMSIETDYEGTTHEAPEGTTAEPLEF